MLHNGPKSSGYVAPNGQNIYPYKGTEETVHHPSDYNSHDINAEVA